MIAARRFHTATLLPDGRVLVAGGVGDDRAAGSAELYDPRNGSWTATGGMIEGRQEHTATLLPDGRVLVVGGADDNRAAGSAELYDAGSGSWTATGLLIEGRSRHTATLLLDGRVLIAGGDSGRGDPFVDGPDPALGSAELYDPSSGTWAATATMNVRRRYHTATLLPDGTVLVAAGVGDSGAERSAELYHPGTGH